MDPPKSDPRDRRIADLERALREKESRLLAMEQGVEATRKIHPGYPPGAPHACALCRALTALDALPKETP